MIPSRPSLTQRRSPAGWRWVWLGLAIVTLVAVGRSSSAEFEVPLISTVNSLANVEFHGIWSFNRGYYSSPNTYNSYEAYAVGVDPDPAKTNDNNGVLYFFDGTKWTNISTPLQGPAPIFSLNDVVGQENHSNGSPSDIAAVGSKGRIAVLSPYSTTPGNQLFIQATVNCPASITDCTTYKSSRDFYTVDAGQSYAVPYLAGGQNGLIASVRGLAGHNIAWTIIDPGPAGAGLGDPSHETITGIQFSNLETAYVTTTRFKEDGGISKSPFEHDCGTGTSSLYKVTNVTSPWTMLKSDGDAGDAVCFYGLAIGNRDEAPSDNSEQKNVIWIASNKGVYKYDEASPPPLGAWSPEPSTVDKPMYSVVAVQDRGGSGQNLINNGNFESWKTNGDPLDPANENIDPDIWLALDKWPGRNNRNGACEDWNNYDLRVSTDVRAGVGYSLGLQPGVSYPPASSGVVNCNDRKWEDLTVTTGAITRVPLSTIEGQKFKISGWYKVQFPDVPVDPDHPLPTMAQGGISVGCAGAFPPSYINCSMSNRSLIKVKDITQPNNGGTNGWEEFSLVISREDLIFGLGSFPQTPITRYSPIGNTPLLTGRKMVLEIGCVAIYGAKVNCDDIKVEELSDPIIAARDTYTVIAAGKELADNSMLINTDALAAADNFLKESIPSKVRTDKIGFVDNQINAMSAVGSQHIFAVGNASKVGNLFPDDGITIFQRTPSSLTGEIWAGAKTEINNSNLAAAIGPISVSCVSAQPGSPTLCQTSPESYGLSLEIHSPWDVTRTGTMAGRAWFGKSTTSDGKDKEIMNLGSCQRPPQYVPAPGGDKYNLTGICNVTKRRCKADIGGSLTARSCLNDFDCYGRCQNDEGFLCVTDDDCQVTQNSFPNSFSEDASTGRLKTPPVYRLICGSTNASPLACTGTGWLTFNKSDDNNNTPDPIANTKIGVSYNRLFAGCGDIIADRCNNNTKICSSDLDCINSSTGNHNSSFSSQNQGAHELTGWGRFMTMKGVPASDGGWVHLRDSGTAFQSTTTLFACRNCDGAAKDLKNCAFCRNTANNSCVPSNDGPGQAQCYYGCQGDNSNGGFSAHCSTNNDCAVGGIGGSHICAPGFCTGDLKTACAEDSECASVGGTCAIGAACKPAGSQCVKYGVNLDTDTGKFYGSAWSGDFGWLDFSSVSYGGKRIIQTKLGDIYATGDIGGADIEQSQGGASCNATYLIASAGDIRGFCSAIGDAGFSGAIQKNVSPIPIISSENSYQNILGRFDVLGMETVTAGSKNKYGTPVISVTPNLPNRIDDAWSTAMPDSAGSDVLGGQVYVVGDGISTYTIDQALNFGDDNISSPIVSGAGILIVNGNLTINADMEYDTASITDLRQLASLTVVVKGNLTIRNQVQKIVGAYYVTGTVNTSDLPSVDNQYPLRVEGLMIAKEFSFKRQFAGTVETPVASELIINDGRLQSNPMLGMVDFTSALPNPIRE